VAANKNVNLNCVRQKAANFMAGTFRTNEEEYFKSLYPLNITEVVGAPNLRSDI
jgi:hypothetical protein